MATKTKAKTVTARVLIAFNDEGHFETEGGWRGRKRDNDEERLKRVRSWSAVPFHAFVDIELPIPKPIKPIVGKVLSVKAVKP